jgi:hypothetical protein
LNISSNQFHIRVCVLVAGWCCAEALHPC